ncbi:hypothetical protein NG54_10390 [Heyndrickxia ginsengihumi]|uniref:Uncharacterized protein n=1 Tax=Heyndrickxia ginsengihumi TaxID=363870 RepID=A0A0A6VAI6_9BACI|nr:hypothetical protein NG54_10390 [Heyndrickxia ginsengihumi]
MQDSCGMSGIAKTPHACSAEEAQHLPTESKHPGAKITPTLIKTVSENKLIVSLFIDYVLFLPLLH